MAACVCRLITDIPLKKYLIAARLLIASIAAALSLSGCGGGDTASTALPTKLLALISSTTSNATFSGKRNDYTIARNGAGFTVRDNASGTSSSIGPNVQTLTFDDLSVKLAIGDIAKSISAADLKMLLELYVGFFNRVPEADGLAYWIAEHARGVAIDQIADSFYAAAISPAYSALTGYSGGMSDAAYVTAVYKNVLGRDPDSAGVTYWSQSLATRSRGALVPFMLSSAHTFKGDATYGYVADLLDNKFAVGSAFALEQGLNYTSAQSSYTNAVAIAAKITPTSTTAAINAIPVNDAGFNLVTSAVVVSGMSTSSTLMYKKLATLTIAGQNLDGAIRVVTPQCSALTELAGASATQRVFTCTPNTVGTFSAQVLSARGDAILASASTAVPAPQVTMKTTVGDMVIELYPTNAPVTVDNFLQYANDSFYNGLIFHRVINSFMIQGGGFNTQLAQLITRAAIKLEAPNGLSNLRGTIAMARTSVRDSATSQFFINVVDNDFLDASPTNDGYAVFGKVVSGMTVADAIKAVPVVDYGSFASIPSTFVVINSVAQTR